MKKLNNILVEDDFMATISTKSDEVFDIREGWKKAEQEGRVRESMYTTYQRVVREIEDCLFLAGIDRKALSNATNRGEIRKLEKKLAEATEEIEKLKAELSRRSDLTQLLSEMMDNVKINETEQLLPYPWGGGTPVQGNFDPFAG